MMGVLQRLHASMDGIRPKIARLGVARLLLLLQARAELCLNREGTLQEGGSCILRCCSRTSQVAEACEAGVCAAIAVPVVHVTALRIEGRRMHLAIHLHAWCIGLPAMRDSLKLMPGMARLLTVVCILSL